MGSEDCRPSIRSIYILLGPGLAGPFINLPELFEMGSGSPFLMIGLIAIRTWLGVLLRY